MNRRIVLWRERQPILNRAMTADLGRHSVASLTIFFLFAKVISYLGNGYLPLLHLIFFFLQRLRYISIALFYANVISLLPCTFSKYLYIRKKIGMVPSKPLSVRTDSCRVEIGWVVANQSGSRDASCTSLDDWSGLAPRIHQLAREQMLFGVREQHCREEHRASQAINFSTDPGHAQIGNHSAAHV